MERVPQLLKYLQNCKKMCEIVENLIERLVNMKHLFQKSIRFNKNNQLESILKTWIYDLEKQCGVYSSFAKTRH